MISQEKLQILTTLQKLPKNVGDLGKLIDGEVAQSPINRPIWSHWLWISLSPFKLGRRKQNCFEFNGMAL